MVVAVERRHRRRPGPARPVRRVDEQESCQPSPSASRKATPDPSVSGRYFLPKAPLLWRKRMPAGAVTSVKWTGSPAPRRPAHAAARGAGKQQRVAVSRPRRDLSARLQPSTRRRSSGARSAPAPRSVLVDLLALVVVVRVQLPVRAGDRLRRLVGLEPHVQRLLARRLLRVAEALVGQHQVVVRLEILRIDRQDLVELRNRRLVVTLRNSTRPSWLTTTRSRG